MVNRTHESQKLTYRVDLPGGQERLRELILYVSLNSRGMERLGLVKLNKILWKADFSAFAERGHPVTGRAYQRLTKGPAPIEMRPLLAEMQQDGLLTFDLLLFGRDRDGREIVEHRPVAQAEPNLRWFSRDDLDYVDAAMRYYWAMTGTETSDDSHGPAWKTRNDLDPMPYEASYLSDAKIGDGQLSRITKIAQERGWKSQ